MSGTSEPNDPPCRISRRRVRYPRLEFTSGRLLLVLPDAADPDGLLEKHRGWIDRKRAFIDDAPEAKEEVESLGATFIDVHVGVEGAAQETGYAREVTSVVSLELPASLFAMEEGNAGAHQSPSVSSGFCFFRDRHPQRSGHPAPLRRRPGVHG